MPSTKADTTNKNKTCNLSFLVKGSLKLILSVPKSSEEFYTFKSLSAKLGVNIENIEITQRILQNM